MATSNTNSYPIGDTVTLSASYTTVEGDAPLDPSAIVLYILDPAGTETTQTYPGQVVRDSVGEYHYDLVVPKSGTWFYKFTGTGTGISTASQDGSFAVQPSVLVPG